MGTWKMGTFLFFDQGRGLVSEPVAKNRNVPIFQDPIFPRYFTGNRYSV